MTPHHHRDVLADVLCTMIVLCRARDVRGEAFWCYLCLKPSMATAFQDARKRGNVDLDEFGTILESGKGECVPLEIKLKMERDFGVNHRYEDDVLKAVEARKRAQ